MSCRVFGAHVGGGAADRAVEIGDPRDAVARACVREKTSPVLSSTRRRISSTGSTALPDHVHTADLELRPLHHHDPDGGPGLLAVDLDSDDSTRACT